MNNKEILDLKKNILDKLSKRQLKNAFELLFKLVVNLQDWQISEKLSELETNYKYMLHYQFENTIDSDKDTIYNRLLRQLYELTDDSSDELLTTESPNFFYERLRLNAVRPVISIEDIRKALREVKESLSLIDLLEDGERKFSEKRSLAIKRERYNVNLFGTIYTSPRATDEDIRLFSDFLSDNDIAVREKSLFISALTLNLFHRFDMRKIDVLLNGCHSDNPMIAQRAIVGLVILIQMYDHRWQLYPECQHKLDVLSESDGFRKSVLSIIKQLIRSRETEEISRKLTNEIIPEMMKFNSLAGKKLNIEDLMGDSDFMDKNPDWKKELESSGLANKLQEYSSLQMEGADVFHSTFASLKSFSFFSEISNWFMPFDLSYSELQTLFPNSEAEKGLLHSAILNSTHMCNSDKYSFSLSLLQLPESQRQMMLGRFGEEAEQLKELQKEAQAINPKIDSEIIANQYIQDLYRFFKLNINRGSFYDIFKLRLNFYDKKAISPLISDKESMLLIANFCFDKNFFVEAEAIYTKLIALNKNDSDIWQRLGYCKQTQNDLEGALNCYLQAELLLPDNSWIIKRIAQIYKSQKNPQLALEYYQRAAQLNPKDVNIELNIGHCYLELGEYEKALNAYFKIDFMDTMQTKAWRPIAWTSFLLRKFDQAHKYYTQILTDKPSVHDYMNAGHVELCIGNKKSALEYYTKAIQQVDNFDKFEQLFDEDKKELILAGVDSSFFPFLLDGLRYKLD